MADSNAITFLRTFRLSLNPASARYPHLFGEQPYQKVQFVRSVETGIVFTTNVWFYGVAFIPLFAAELSSVSRPEEVFAVRETKVSPRDETYQRCIPPYNVILENDDYHSHTFVVSVLCKALGHSMERAYQLMLQAHQTGRAIVWTAPKEIAELKAEQIGSFREEPYGPLGCSIEPC